MRARAALLAAALLTAAGGCTGDVSQRQNQRVALFVGVDVSGSFYYSKFYDDSLEFLAHYLYGHMNGDGNLFVPKELYVGTIGGTRVNDLKSFHNIYDFQAEGKTKTPDKIKADLKAWFPKAEGISDFNIFFKQVANKANERNLSLMPIVVVMLSDGIPALPGKGDRPDVAHFGNIDLGPLEYLSKNVTVRLLYADPNVSNQWETAVPRRRVKMWTVDSTNMTSWKSQVLTDVADQDKQDKLWTWVADIVDHRVTATKLQAPSKKKR